MIRVGPSEGKGRGIFATRTILPNELIEEGPVVVVPPEQVPDLDRTILGDYYFMWGEESRSAAILLGLCSLCNHSYTPNAHFERHQAEGVVRFVAIREIAAGEEITVNYNEDPGDLSAVWFPV